MSNNKQSSIEWFKKELEDYGTSERVKIDWKTFDELFEQANAMHKQEMIDFAFSWSHEQVTKQSIENEYNQTFQ